MASRCFVTGSAGFIGFHLSQRLLEEGHEVAGIDNFYPYYPPILKEARHNILKQYKNFHEVRLNLVDLVGLEKCFHEYQPQLICHLAAQAGVRYSLINPFIYQQSNLEGFLNIIELARKNKVSRFVYASSSSVYGNLKEVPYREDQPVDTPISLYAATKRANELIAHTYTHLYGLATVGLRFFTAYGPWGRPDMAMWLFSDAILAGRPIEVYNHGKMYRDFTYIQDIVAGTRAAMFTENLPPYEIFNLGNHCSENIMKVVSLLEQTLGRKATVNFAPLQPGDVEATCANIDKAKKLLGFAPTTPIEEGIPRFISWFLQNAELVTKIREASKQRSLA